MEGNSTQLVGSRAGSRRTAIVAARVRLGLLCVVSALFVGLVASATAAALNVSGTWNANYHCEQGWCAGEDFPAPGVVFVQAKGSDEVHDGTAVGILKGNTMTIHGGSPGEYQFDQTLTFSADGKSFTGPLSDSNGTSGTDTGVKVSGPPPETVKVAGSVRDDLGHIAPGVTLTLKGTSDEEEQISQSTTSNLYGEYSFEVPTGKYSVAASGEMSEENGGKLSVTTAAATPGGISIGGGSATGPPECTGKAKEATCELDHLEVGETGKANFTYTYCAASDRLPNGKPPTHCPIVFIPGFLGSRLQCSTGEVWTNIPNPDFKDMPLQTNGVANSGAPGSCSDSIEPIPGQEGVVSSAAGADIYGAALAFLNRIAPERVYALTYDWRKSPLLADVALNKLVEEVLSKTGASRVVLMAHSMGGLVTQGYIADPTHAEKVIRAITLGTPYWGAPKSHMALLAGKSGEAVFEPGLDQLVDVRSLNLSGSAENSLQLAARTMQGLFWLYPSADYGPWLSITGRSFSSALRGGSAIDPWVALLGGVPSLLDSAIAGHADLHSLVTNGVDYQILVGTGVATVTSMHIDADPLKLWPEITVFFGSGDGTVPVRSAARAQLDDSSSDVPITPVCGISHVGLPGAASVQAGIEGFLLQGKAVTGAEHCGYHGKEVEIINTTKTATAPHASSVAGETARVITPVGTSLTLAQASAQELIQVIAHADQTIVVTDSRHPVTLVLSGKAITVKTRSLTSTGKEGPGSAGPPEYFGPVNGTLALPQSGPVTRNGKPLKAAHAHRPPRTTAHIARRGRLFVVRLTARAGGGVAGTYVEIGKGASHRYRKPLMLTAKQLGKLRFASVDRFGIWEHPERASRPH
jgi:pimeloyl-ACP methyl ester carboxylesterase